MTHYSTDSFTSNLLTILSFNQHTDSYLPVNLSMEVLFPLKLNKDNSGVPRDCRVLLNLQSKRRSGELKAQVCQAWKTRVVMIYLY